MRLNTIYDLTNNRKRSKRVGRGIGSGKGKTCGSGHKGQKARSGVAVKGFEGGQMPIYRRLPKRGFNNPNKTSFKVVNLGEIDKAILAKKLDPKNITKQNLKDVGLIANVYKPVKLLSKGTLTHKITIEVDYVSKTANSVITELLGEVKLMDQSIDSSKASIAQEDKLTEKNIVKENNL